MSSRAYPNQWKTRQEEAGRSVRHLSTSHPSSLCRGLFWVHSCKCHLCFQLCPCETVTSLVPHPLVVPPLSSSVHFSFSFIVVSPGWQPPFNKVSFLGTQAQRARTRSGPSIQHYTMGFWSWISNLSGNNRESSLLVSGVVTVIIIICYYPAPWYFT